MSISIHRKRPMGAAVRTTEEDFDLDEIQTGPRSRRQRYRRVLDLYPRAVAPIAEEKIVRLPNNKRTRKREDEEEVEETQTGPKTRRQRYCSILDFADPAERKLFAVKVDEVDETLTGPRTRRQRYRSISEIYMEGKSGRIGGSWKKSNS
ncbi:hypothetical protein Cni_G14678 [Canna indica]|uniref:Uncharacterized protein n=1 Tax=Canna indica TaxID=4628 RepID=A0AAQ3KCI9_9LILI|nr:hypothetical protein Cni_G14678 [Canna indica]